MLKNAGVANGVHHLVARIMNGVRRSLRRTQFANGVQERTPLGDWRTPFANGVRRRTAYNIGIRTLARRRGDARAALQ
jgi:hypothetical protein